MKGKIFSTAVAFFRDERVKRLHTDFKDVQRKVTRILEELKGLA